MPSGDPKGSLNTSCSEPKVPLVPRMGHSALTPSKEYVIDAQSLHLDFFDIKCSKKNPNSKNRYTNQILSTTCYEQNWLLEVANGVSNATRSEAKLSEGKTEYFSQTKASIDSKDTNLLMTVGEQSSPTVPQSSDLFIKNIEIKSNRKTTTKILRRDDTSIVSEGRSVVNIALEKYSKRVKIKTLFDKQDDFDIQ